MQKKCPQNPAVAIPCLVCVRTAKDCNAGVTPYQYPSPLPAICMYRSLQKLSVAHNKLTSLPESLSRVTSLIWLNIKSNSIQQLKGNIRLWGRLQVKNGTLSRTRHLHACLSF